MIAHCGRPTLAGYPEIRHYQRREIEGAVIVTYEVRLPCERNWTPVRLVRIIE